MITVIIPCYNTEKWIGEAIQSVLDQAISAIEIIVVDDGSTDQSAEIVRNKYPSVRLICTENRGASAARNTGTAAASGEYLQYLDADDRLAVGKLSQQMKLLEQTGADVAYGDWQRLVPTIAGDFTPGEIICRQMQDDPEIELFTDFWCPPAAYLFRRQIVEKVGQWNIRLPVIQDARFVLDCALHGATFAYCPGVMAYYRTHITDSLSRRNAIAFNRDIFTNASEIHQWWREHGGITPDRKNALLGCYGYVARSCFECDPETFQKAYAALMALNPRYVPAQPKHLRYTARVLGYKNAEQVASWYRRAKAVIRP